MIEKHEELIVNCFDQGLTNAKTENMNVKLNN